jgi:hypothetical protein
MIREGGWGKLEFVETLLEIEIEIEHVFLP